MSNAMSQDIYQIDFSAGTTGDFDLIIKRLLEDHNIKAYVKYPDSKSNPIFDYRIEYHISAKPTSDALNLVKLRLYDSLGNKLHEAERKVVFFGNDSKDVCKTLKNLMGQKISCSGVKDEYEVYKLNIGFEVKKLDSALYEITAKGAGIHSLETVSEAFLEKAGQYLKEFDYYIESGRYNYSAPAPGGPTYHNAYYVEGIIRPLSKDKQSPNLLEDEP
jgi:hypothetical protein